MKKIFLAISVYFLSTPMAIANNCCEKCKEWGIANLNGVTSTFATNHTSCETTTDPDVSVTGTYIEGCVASQSIDIGTGAVKVVNTDSGLVNPYGDSSTQGTAPCYFDTTNGRIIAYSKVLSIYYQCQEGYYGTATSSGTGCTACPTNATCTGGANPSIFTCNKGYYKSGNLCIKCPQANGHATTAYSSNSTSSAEDDDITDCFIYTGYTWRDTSGDFELSQNCYYSTSQEDVPCVCGTSTNLNCSICTE